MKKKKVIKLTESQLSDLIKKTVKNVIKEDELNMDDMDTMDDDDEESNRGLEMVKTFQQKLEELIAMAEEIEHDLGEEHKMFGPYIFNYLKAIHGDYGYSHMYTVEEMIKDITTGGEDEEDY